MKLENLKNCIESELKEIYVLNQSLTPMLGALKDIKHLKRLINMSNCSKGLKIRGKIAAFMICFREDSEYESKNYLYFNRKYKEFLYVDRIGVSKNLENNGLGSILYKDVIENFGEDLKICAEINIRPMNEKSIIFHEKHDFKKVLEKCYNENYKVVFMERNASSSKKKYK